MEWDKNQKLWWGGMPWSGTETFLLFNLTLGLLKTIKIIFEA